jgi:hypothetical protein
VQSRRGFLAFVNPSPPINYILLFRNYCIDLLFEPIIYNNLAIQYNVHIINGIEGILVKTKEFASALLLSNVYAMSWSAAVIKTVFSTSCYYWSVTVREHFSDFHRLLTWKWTRNKTFLDPRWWTRLFFSKCSDFGYRVFKVYKNISHNSWNLFPVAKCGNNI